MVNKYSNLRESIEILSKGADDQISYLERIGHLEGRKKEHDLTNIDELALQFYDEYQNINELENKGHISKVLRTKINLISECFDEENGKNIGNFWTVMALRTDARWEKIREISTNCLKLMEPR